MVYCSKCGTLNADDATVCSKCGAPLQPAGTYDYGPYWRHRHYHYEYDDRPHGFGALFVGIIIIAVGLTFLLSEVYNFQINWGAWWALVIILVGVWFLFVAYRRSRRHRYRPSSHNAYFLFFTP
jgi:hypothetical protein